MTPACGHRHCGPWLCRFADTSDTLILMRQGDRRDAHNFNLMALAAPKLSRRGKLALYSGIAYREIA